MSLTYPNAERQEWDTIRIAGYNVEIVMKNNTYVTFPVEMMRRSLNDRTLTTDDVRAIVKDEMQAKGWYKG